MEPNVFDLFPPIVIRLDGSQPVRYGIKVEVDDKYRSLKQSLSELCGIPSSKLLLVEISGSVIRVRMEGGDGGGGWRGGGMEGGDGGVRMEG